MRRCPSMLATIRRSISTMAKQETETVKDCHYPWTWMHVETNGRVKPCCHARGDLGNLSTAASADAIWTGPFAVELRAFIKRNKVHPVCAGAVCKFVENMRKAEAGNHKPRKERKPRWPFLSSMWQAARRFPQKAVRTAVFVRNLLDVKVLWTDISKTQIGIMVRGGVGDVVIAARWLRSVIPDITSKADVAIDIYYASPENIVFIFGKFPNVRYLYRDITFDQVREYYDFSFVINHLGYIEVDYLRLEAKIANLPFADVVRSWSAGIAKLSPFTTSDYHPD